MLGTQARWNIINARRKGTLTMLQLKEEIKAEERRAIEDIDGIPDTIPPYDEIDDIVQKGTIQPIRIW